MHAQSVLVNTLSGERHKVWTRKLDNGITWSDLDSMQTVSELSEKLLPEMWRGESREAAAKAGHGDGNW